MSLKDYLNDKKIKKQDTSSIEISDLFDIAKRDLNDMSSGKNHISLDWQFGILYNSVLKLCTILLRAEGYRAGSMAHHKITIECLPFVMGSEKEKYSRYLNDCRIKRNKVEYDKAGLVSEDDVQELSEFTKDFYSEVEKWMYTNHPNLIK